LVWELDISFATVDVISKVTRGETDKFSVDRILLPFSTNDEVDKLIAKVPVRSPIQVIFRKVEEG
jgi:hypothetical protein